ncbi:hypothetical protein G6F65_019261 [Rhizopus arrhizus]|nr:hypothetical protein G6F65_019261 [Rhizopus arrhizus]
MASASRCKSRPTGCIPARPPAPAPANRVTPDPYAFGPLLSAQDLDALASGDWRAALEWLGARLADMDGIPGLRCAVWAPNARRVAVVGDFNSWDGRRHPMRLRHAAGVWELFIPAIQAGERYKFAITDANGAIALKADPMARRAQAAPATASVYTPAPGSRPMARPAFGTNWPTSCPPTRTPWGSRMSS